VIIITTTSIYFCEEDYFLVLRWMLEEPDGRNRWTKWLEMLDSIKPPSIPRTKNISYFRTWWYRQHKIHNKPRVIEKKGLKSEFQADRFSPVITFDTELKDKYNPNLKKKFANKAYNDKKRLERQQTDIITENKASDTVFGGNKQPIPIQIASEADLQERKHLTRENLLKEFELVKDTRGWTWQKWSLFFTGKKLLKYQIKALNTLEKYYTIKTIARQHGKTSYILEIFILRKLCESVFDYIEGIDRPICYISSSDPNAKRMLVNIRTYLMVNQQILNWYGDLVDTDYIEGKKLRSASNTMYELRLITLVDKLLYSMFSTTPKSGIRGNNFYYVIVDDGVDYNVSKDKSKKARNIVKETDQFLDWLDKKIAPLCKGFLYIVGTRYGKNDLYMQLYKKNIYALVNYPAITGPIPSFVVPEPKFDEEGHKIPVIAKDIQIEFEAELLAPEIWATKTEEPIPPGLSGTPTQNICFKIHQIGMNTFMQEYQNDPKQQNNKISYEQFLICDQKIVLDNVKDYSFIQVIDPASGKTTDSDITSITTVAKNRKQKQYYILDIIYGRFDGREKKQELSDFKFIWFTKLGIHSTKLPVWVEVVRNRDFWNRLAREPNLPGRPLRPINEFNPAGRGTKEERITNNLIDELSKGNVFITAQCRGTDQLLREVEGFPDVHPDVLDSIDSAIYQLDQKRGASFNRLMM
jgi:phage terminase large subunit-like protein